MDDTLNSGDSPRLESDESRNEASSREESVLSKAHARFDLATEAWTDLRLKALEDQKFLAGEQWPDQIKAERAVDGRPCLVINRLPQFVQQVTNDQRQNRPSIKAHPVDSGADIETAKIISGLIRHIEYNSNADAAYDTGFEGAASGGFGFWRVLTDFTDPESFDQEILIKRIRDPMSVTLDPFSQEPDGSDTNWAFITDDLALDDYKSRYPSSKLASRGTEWESLGNSLPDWVKKDTVRVAEYFYKEMRETTLYRLATGETVLEEKLAEKVAQATAAGLDASIIASRPTKIPVIKWLKINGVEILEETIWPGRYIPIVPVYGAERFIDGKRILESVIRNAIDSQRMYNYWASAETEAIALAPRTPFLVAAGQIKGFEEQWATANRRNHPFLSYNPISSSGQPVPPPQRQAFEPAVQAITHARMIAAEDLKSTTGIYDASLGSKSNETSGIAIQRRNNQAQTANFHFIDNLARSQRHTGRILVNLIPKIYDTARAERILGEDGEAKIVRLNERHLDENGKEVIYDLNAGRYDVTMDTGPSFATKRQEAAASMMEVSKAAPQLMQVAGDLLVKNMDWPGAQEIADRIKKTLPPGLADDPKGQQPLPPQVQAQMSQMHQMIENLTAHLNDATQTIQMKRLEIESREKIELAKIQAQLEMKGAELGSKEDMALLNHQIQSIQHQLEMLHAAHQADQQIQAQQESVGADGAQADPNEPDPTGGEPAPGSPMEG